MVQVFEISKLANYPRQQIIRASKLFESQTIFNKRFKTPLLKLTNHLSETGLFGPNSHIQETLIAIPALKKYILLFIVLLNGLHSSY